jgi:hypothetical protein
VSEYQYYEFRALERLLSADQQAELRECSKRAKITSTSFINEYHWGDFPAEPLDWMTEYFDAHVYSASWGECHFMLTVPLVTLDRATVLEFSGEPFEITELADRWVLTWAMNLDGLDHQRFIFKDGPGWLKRLQGLRQELMNGDLRPLYLGWISRMCAYELDDEALEPTPPPGLRKLTPAQAALAKFLLLDQDILSVAADDGGARRTVAQLEESRKAAEQLRLEKERVQRERRKKKAQLERAARLTEVASRTEAVWQEIERLLLLTSGASYTQAESAIVELAEALTAAGRRDEFDAALARKLAANGKRQGWRNRLRAAGLI